MTHTLDQLNDRLQDLPSRVLLNAAGQATTPGRARDEFGIDFDIVFVRDDLWMLGAPRSLERVAFDTWAGSWIAFAEAPDFKARWITDLGRDYYDGAEHHAEGSA